METFYSLQGEGYHTGEAAFFIRIGGCDIGCRWCDVKESWNPDIHPLVNISDIIHQAVKVTARVAVITGGEPLMYNLDPLCELLHQHHFKTHLETSGAYPLSGKWDWICLSPKKNNPPRNEILQLANELKVIIFNESDIAWAETYAKLVSPSCKLYLQPEWSRYKYITPYIISYIQNHPVWKISLQAHKFMNIP